MQVYLDNGATTKVDPDVIQVMIEMMEREYGNPSSLHRMGMQAEQRVKEARRKVSKALGVTAEEILFTSGGTEATNMALQGVLQAYEKQGKHIISTEIEHPATLRTLERMVERGWELTLLHSDQDGRVSVDAVKDALRPDTVLVSIMHVNNETGAIQPVQEIARVLKKMKQKPFFHIDGIQALGKIPVKLKRLQADFYSISGHKLHGPKGVGALYVRKGTRIAPLVFGGGQESGTRPGTENVPGIVGLGIAVQKAVETLEERMERMRSIKKTFWDRLREGIPAIELNGQMDNALFAPHIINITFPGMRGEVLLHTLEEKGISVSTGSACASKNKSYSHVLTAMGKSEAQMEGAIRFSFNAELTDEQMEYAADEIVRAVRQLDEIIQGR